MRSPTASSTPSASGFTLIEVMMAMSVLLIAVLALSTTQIIASRANRQSDRTVQASALATDLAENMGRWAYNDPRLAPQATVTTTNDPSIQAKWDMGTAATVPSAQKAQFSDAPVDVNATNANSLNSLGPAYQGLSANLADGGASAGGQDFIRYWNVFAIDPCSLGTPLADGLLVQIIVRWADPGYGFRQITSSAFKTNAQAQASSTCPL
jgi:prepilin-type N-terminal cleavage/methylation domain-containing protein